MSKALGTVELMTLVRQLHDTPLDFTELEFEPGIRWTMCLVKYNGLAHGNAAGIDFTIGQKCEFPNQHLPRWLVDEALVDLTGVCMIQTNLNGAILKSCSLFNARLNHANLTKADISWSDLHRADLSDALLIEANLRCCHLGESSFRRADLRRANLIGCDFWMADFRSADLRGADMTDAENLDMANLRGALYDQQTKLPTGDRAIDPRRANMIFKVQRS
jgi:uncharacterized protein YjbI with pentapeptide repeats